MYKKILPKLLLLGGVLCVCFGLPATRANADVNNFVINNFAATYELHTDAPGGRLVTQEKITLTFSDYNHGILRAIPLSYKGHSVKLHIDQVLRDQNVEPYTTSTSNGNEVLKIGDANKTITGQHSYTIEYSQQNVISFYKDYDELYWDTNGTQWQQSFEQVSADVTLPKPVDFTHIPSPVCYTGLQGATATKCVYQNRNQTQHFETTHALQPGENLSFVVGFPKGYFKAPSSADWWRDHLSQIIGIVLPPLIVGIGAFVYWIKKGKDVKGRGVIIPEYGPPDGLKPIEVGTLVDYKTDNRDISATIIDLAVRGYIKIIETKKERLLRKDQLEYTLELANDNLEGLDATEHSLINALFDSQIVKGRQVNVAALKNSLAPTVLTIRERVTKSLVERGYFPSNPGRARLSLYTVAVVILFLAFQIHSLVSLGFILSAGLAALFGALMKKRTAKGVAAKDAIEGLKLYLKTAEAERLKMLQSPDAPYASQSDAPTKTVDLFEKLLPYAIVLGVEKEWAAQFNDIYKQPPGWYSGNWTTFNAVYFATTLNNSVTAMGTSFSPPSSSSGSGFSAGGGFSGGGGGGGGGGGW